MMEKLANWQSRQLASILTLKYGKGLPERERQLGDYPVYGSGGIVGFHSTRLVQGPGIIVGRKGSIGTVYYERKDFYPIDTVFYVERKDTSVDLKFLYYLLSISGLNRLNSDAAVPGLNREIAHKQFVKIPDSKIQQKIASIFSAYDDLIENNTRRIKILEEMAQTIYRHWFVNFKFPGHKNTKFKDSKLRKIPEGWEVLPLGDVLAGLESGSRPKGGINENDCDVPSIGAENIIGLGQYDYGKEKYVNREFYENMRRGHIKSGDVLLYKDGASIGRKSLFRDGFPHETCCINEHVFILRTNEKCSQNYLYFWLDQPKMTQNIKNLNANAAQPGINQQGVKGLQILVADKPLRDNFESLIESMLGELFNLAKKNNVLRRTRDLLLPKLINGEVEV